MYQRSMRIFSNIMCRRVLFKQHGSGAKDRLSPMYMDKIPFEIQFRLIEVSCPDTNFICSPTRDRVMCPPHLYALIPWEVVRSVNDKISPHDASCYGCWKHEEGLLAPISVFGTPSCRMSCGSLPNLAPLHLAPVDLMDNACTEKLEKLILAGRMQSRDNHYSLVLLSDGTNCLDCRDDDPRSSVFSVDDPLCTDMLHRQRWRFAVAQYRLH
jgi:hypothetical protein